MPQDPLKINFTFKDGMDFGCSQALTVLSSTAKLLWTLAQQERDNKEEIKRLSSHATNLHRALDERCGASQTIPQNLLELIEPLTTALSDITVMLQELQNQSYLKRFLWSIPISDRISKAYADINHAFQILQLGSFIDIVQAQKDVQSLLLAQSNRARKALEPIQQGNGDIIESLEVPEIALQEALHLRAETTNSTTDVRRIYLEKSVLALQRRSGPNRISPNVPVITSFDIIITREELGTGGFGKVYKGFWKGNMVAVKVLNDTVPMNMMLSEVDVWKRLKHPNILQFFGANPFPTQPFLVSALMEYGDATEFLRRNPRADRTQILLDTATGLAYLHQDDIRVVHRDLKPSNILIDHEGKACISDFGLSKLKQHLTTVVQPTNKRASIMQMGTIRYMAPEQIQHSSSSRSIDIYAFAMTAFEIFTGEPPFSQISDERIVEIVVDRKERPVCPPLDECPFLEERMWKLMERAWVPDPLSRPKAIELVAELSSWKFQAPLSEEPQSIPIQLKRY
ncbi:hypothetical protein NLI96_g11320 [Meripilus lineatus]|uniref:Protein kinase domain-containing protein n=1 Tax=Meripilus lineatus TaxID=2056292 RepID=A0AAD5YDE1_9APHY|nr:hypothetical protein NLI96_g11320 [Physisporinus lineatus]